MFQPGKPKYASNNLEQTILTMRILTITMALSVGMLGSILFSLGKWNVSGPTFQVLLQDSQVRLLGLVGILFLILRIPVANQVFRTVLVRIQNFEDIKSIVIAYFAPHVIRLALAEASAMLGFVVSLMHGETTAFLILGTSGLLAILREFPSLERIKLIANAIHRIPNSSRKN